MNQLSHHPVRPSVASLFRTTPEHVRHPLKVWPYTWTSMRDFVLAFIVMTVGFTAAGFAVTEWFEPTSLGQAEADLAVWLEESRTDTLTDLAQLASIPSNTPVKIGLMAVAAIVFPLVWRRWHDWAFLVGALLLEVSVYGLSSFLVGRPRPPVDRLAEAPTESFPSGHVAAAVTFYVGLAIIVHWQTESRPARRASMVVGAVIPLGMIASRLYLGMHYVSDVIGGVILGALSLVVALNIARDGVADTNAEIDEHQPAVTRALDQTA